MTITIANVISTFVNKLIVLLQHYSARGAGNNSGMSSWKHALLVGLRRSTSTDAGFCHTLQNSHEL